VGRVSRRIKVGGNKVGQKTALVTGACGFIGENLVKKLEESEMNVLKVDKKLNPDFDVANFEFPKLFVNKKINYVFHFGSPCSVLQFNENPVYCIENTLSGFKNIITLTKRAQAKLIYPSSGNVYGRLNPPHKEDMEPEPTNLYGVAKVEAENMVKLSGIDAVGLRIFTGYGFREEKKGNLASVVCLFLLDMMKGKPPIIWGDGEQERDCIFIEDIVKSAINAAEFEVPEIINVGSGVRVTYNRIVETINEVLETNIEPVYEEKPQNFVDKAVADIWLMRKNLKVEPIKLEEGLKKFVEYLEGKRK
jgi:nucleoside-diphosphate-sugar epimerase